MKQTDINLGAAEPVLERFKDFVLKWQHSVNLISKSTIDDMWTRHILDSAQVYEHIPAQAKVMADMGSGGGFPGLVLAIMNKELTGSLTHIYLIESDIKKSVFLREAVREFALPVSVINDRIERVRLDNVDVVTARALKELKDLLVLSKGFVNPQTMCLFLKGERVDEEIKTNPYPCRIEKIKSKTHENGYILKIGDIHL